jgi:23S rRNA (adenine2503-C2)-methyltransferase
MTNMTIWPKVERLQSSDTDVLKYVFESKDAVAEAVLYKYPTYNERTVVCCSTQSGCPIGCRFCGAGDAFVRSLTAEEIVAQVDYLFESQNIDATQVQRMQIMTMAMGEPLLNQKELIPALYILNQKYPQAALLISTSAPRVDYSPIMRASEAISKVGLQFSIHESTDFARDQLIPFKKKLTLQEIAVQGEVWAAATGRRPFFNYCAHDKNSSNEDADRLVNLFNPAIWEATISVICEREESIAAANERQRKLAEDFCSKLNARGYSTRVFNPAGQDDIGGGCGQLWRTQSWMKNNPDLAKPSVGRGLPAVHTPCLNP